MCSLQNDDHWVHDKIADHIYTSGRKIDNYESIEKLNCTHDAMKWILIATMIITIIIIAHMCDAQHWSCADTYIAANNRAHQKLNI